MPVEHDSDSIVFIVIRSIRDQRLFAGNQLYPEKTLKYLSSSVSPIVLKAARVAMTSQYRVGYSDYPKWRPRIVYTSRTALACMFLHVKCEYNTSTCPKQPFWDVIHTLVSKLQSKSLIKQSQFSRESARARYEVGGYL